MSRLLKYIKEPWRIVVAFDRHIISIVPDKLYIECLYRSLVGEKLDLRNPKKYCEKLQWLKLYDRNPEYYKFTDKLLVRNEVVRLVGKDILVPLIGQYDSFEDIDFNELPERFVLKCSHDSGSAIICKDKNTFDYEFARKKLNLYLKRDFWRIGRESAYNSKGKVKPCIICEKYIYENEDIAFFPDYKFFCFDGKVRMFQVNSRRGTKEGVHTTFFDRDGNACDMQNPGFPRDKNIEPPKELNKLIYVAEKLAKGFAHIRIDLLLYRGKIYFSEYTFYHCGGFFPFIPNKWNRIMGDYLKLPE